MLRNLWSVWSLLLSQRTSLFSKWFYAKSHFLLHKPFYIRKELPCSPFEEFPRFLVGWRKTRCKLLAKLPSDERFFFHGWEQSLVLPRRTFYYHNNYLTNQVFNICNWMRKDAVIVKYADMALKKIQITQLTFWLLYFLKRYHSWIIFIQAWAF